MIQRPPNSLFFSILFIFIFQINIFSQTEKGKIIESEKMQSSILDRSVRYSIYLPHGYDDTNRKYPVTYLLHGYTGCETDWVQYGNMDRLVDEAIASGDIPPMIIVMPDAENSWYINDHKNAVRYDDFFIKEFIPFIEKKYRVRSQKEFRGITGLSMGGYGSLLYAIKYPEMFAACAPLSAAIFTEEETIEGDQKGWDEVGGPLFGKGLSGKDRITDHWKSYNPFYMAKAADLKKLKSVRYYFDCGDDDFLYEGNAEIHILFRDLGIPHEFRMRDGDHSWHYWRTGLIPALQFIGKSFTR